MRTAWAHVVEDTIAAGARTAAEGAAPTLGAGWELDPWVVTPLVLVAALYTRGVLRAGRLHPGVPPRQAAAFALGWLSLALALMGKHREVANGYRTFA